MIAQRQRTVAEPGDATALKEFQRPAKGDRRVERERRLIDRLIAERELLEGFHFARPDRMRAARRGLG